ncbi:MAG: DUF1266 domain-containing protein [Hungatella sp.]|nr:DUF1266 domain-containing protein [Hungatella sp.]
MNDKKIRRMLAVTGMAAVLAASALQGCGGGKDSGSDGADAGNTKAAQETTKAEETKADLTKDMTEFTIKDGSMSIMLNKDWTTEDLGVDFWLGAQSKNGKEAVIVMQFPKMGSILPVDSMDSMTAMVVESYGIADEADAQAPTIPGMTGIKASTCTVNADGEKAETYLVYGETDYAYYSLMYVTEDKMTDDIIASAVASYGTFKETPPEVEDNSTIQVSDTVKWFNASYAVLTKLNGWNYNLFGGLAVNDDNKAVVQEMLKSWWDVSDRASADETLDWILTEGHRTGFVEEMKDLQSEGVGDKSPEERAAAILGVYEMDEATAEIYARCYGAYETMGEKAIDGWDYCRALNLLGYYYTAGYYTDVEALDKSLEIAQKVQEEFGSWDELIDSYMVGYEYWGEETSDERRAVYEELKGAQDNPYAVDFKMTLEKTW